MFLLEGYKAIKEAFDFGIKIEFIFAEKSHAGDYAFAKNLITETNSAVLKKLCSTESAPPAVAVAYQKQYNLEQFKELSKVILLEGIKDLGNLGTIIRSGVAFGCDGIILFGDCADLYNPRMGLKWNQSRKTRVLSTGRIRSYQVWQGFCIAKTLTACSPASVS